MKEDKQNQNVPLMRDSGRTGEEQVIQGQGSVKEKKLTKIGRHGAEMIMTTDPKKNEQMVNQVGLPDGLETPATLGERIKLVQKLISQSMGIEIPEDKVPDKIGFDIKTDSQKKVLFTILRLMTETNYRGDYQVPNSQVIKRGLKHNASDIVQAQTQGYIVKSTGTHIGGPYENIPSTPVLKITKRDLMIQSGFDPDSGSDVRDFGIAMGDLELKQHFLMWTRYAKDNKGKAKRRSNGHHQYELVSTFSPVLIVNSVYNPQTKVFQYYEISPAPVFLDEISRDYGGERGGYFLLIPEDSYQEVNEAYRRRYPTRKGKTPDIIQALCFWFRLKVGEIQGKEKNPFATKVKENRWDGTLRVSFLDLCQELDYGEAYAKKHRGRIMKTLTDGIELSEETGYLLSHQYIEETDEFIFKLNLDYYPATTKNESQETQQGEIESVQETSLF